MVVVFWGCTWEMVAFAALDFAVGSTVLSIADVRFHALFTTSLGFAALLQ